MPVVNVFLDEQLYRMLREVAALYGMSINEVIKAYIIRGLRGEYDKKFAVTETVVPVKRVEGRGGDSVKCRAIIEELRRITEKLSMLAVEMKKCAEAEKRR